MAYERGGLTVLPRTVSCGGTNTCSATVWLRFIRSRRSRAPVLPISSAGKLTVVRGGFAISAIDSLTMPTMERSSGYPQIPGA